MKRVNALRNMPKGLTEKQDKAYDKKAGIKEDSKADKAMDKKHKVKK